MTIKTKEYDRFIFRSDNREKIDQTHVRRLEDSIKARNMLDLRPIIVNEIMEIIDGQHRLLAAKNLGLEIYYQVQKNITARDILLLNISKNWTTGDILNHYCRNGQQEYIKLRQFMKENNLTLKVALNITMGNALALYKEFREGRYKYNDDLVGGELDICWDTINYIKKMNGFSPYTSSARFWKALLKLVRHEKFSPEKWRYNLQRMVERFCPKARVEDYQRMMMEVYNYRNNERVNLLEEVLG